MSDIATLIAAAVEEQARATQEISRNVTQAARTAQVATNITDVSRGASDTGMASSQVLSSARPCRAKAAVSRAKSRSFVRTVRAA